MNLESHRVYQTELGGRQLTIETGKYDPSLPLAFAMARLFDLAIEEIFSDDQGAPEATR